MSRYLNSYQLQIINCSPGLWIQADLLVATAKKKRRVIFSPHPKTSALAAMSRKWPDIVPWCHPPHLYLLYKEFHIHVLLESEERACCLLVLLNFLWFSTCIYVLNKWFNCTRGMEYSSITARQVESNNHLTPVWACTIRTNSKPLSTDKLHLLLFIYLTFWILLPTHHLLLFIYLPKTIPRPTHHLLLFIYFP